jgi:lipopolysaccharide/colanic/teichoic acid biosynthesis glycosyltransferase
MIRDRQSGQGRFVISRAQRGTSLGDMRIQPPSSRAIIKIRLSLFDVVLAALSPLLALYLRDAYILSYDGILLAGLYCFVSFGFSLIALAAFGAHAGIPRYFSVHDAIDLTKAVLLGELMTCVVLFTATRLEGIPRSTPVIHALIFGAGLITVRALAHIAGRNRRSADLPRPVETEHIILIGLNDLSSLYMKVLEACAPGQRAVVAVLDETPRSIGRSINGIRIYGPPSHLQSLIEEFSVHGISIDRVVLGGDTDMLSDESRREIERVCTRHNLTLEFVPRLFGIEPAKTKTVEAPRGGGIEPSTGADPASGFVPPAYFRVKRVIDFIAALTLVIALLPLWLVVASLTLLHIGPPVLFWQRRTGLNGKYFLLHKIRTLRAPFGWRGVQLSHTQRLSWFGRLLRTTRLDELPQLLNVLVGDMSLIGPRPLLPQDQPASRSVRLLVRPGITGWAQVNGGTLLSPKEKADLDEWYIRHASLLIDLRIIGMTVLCLLRGDRRCERALLQAGSLPTLEPDGSQPGPRQTKWPISAVPIAPLLNEDSPPHHLAR